jgi:tRNA G37 N-methylase Trm5
MPLPKSAEDFLDNVLHLAKDGTIIHFYDFLNEQLGEIPGKAVEKIDAACRRNKFSYEILTHVKCGDHAPHTYRVCVDFKVKRK